MNFVSAKCYQFISAFMSSKKWVRQKYNFCENEKIKSSTYWGQCTDAQ